MQQYQKETVEQVDQSTVQSGSVTRTWQGKSCRACLSNSEHGTASALTIRSSKASTAVKQGVGTLAKELRMDIWLGIAKIL